MTPELRGFAMASVGRLQGLLVIALLSGCAAEADGRAADTQAQAPLPRVSLCLQDREHSMALQAELAETNEQRRIGLMGRQTLAEDEGMLFVYEHERSAGNTFWMYKTLLPLDIAYLGPDGEVRAIAAMAPCLSDDPSSCPSYEAGVPHWTALEVNQGFFTRQGFDVGARISRAEPAGCAPAGR